MTNEMTARIDFLVEQGAWLADRRGWLIRLEHDTKDAEICQEIAEKIAAVEQELAPLRAELEDLGAIITDNGGIRWE